MSDLDLISVIVPVYKVEPYLDRCVQSIADQTYKNLEIILVDDGSPDRCPEMCDAWAQKDPRIRVIHQKNAGAGAARNVGMDVATGNIVAFVDSDDYLAPQMYEHLMSLMSNDVDIAECELFPTDRLNADFPSTTAPFTVAKCNTTDALRKHIANHSFCQTPVNKLYRRHTVQSIPFPTGKLIDDEYWTYQVLSNAKTLVHSNLNLYAYLQQPGSVMHISYSLRRLQAIEAKDLRRTFMADKFPALLPQATANLWATGLYHGQMSLRHLSKTEQKEAFSYLKKVLSSISRKTVFHSDISFIYRIWFLLSKLSFKGTCRLRNILKIGL